LLREYDFTIITKGDLSETDTLKVLEGYENLMTGAGGEILKKDVWGMRKLSYPIKKVFRGHYVNYDFVGTPENVAEMERLMRIDDSVLRHLVIRLDESSTGTVDVPARKAELARLEKEAREAEAKRRKEMPN
jgi:small subunit ribosomal protein S6